MLQLRKQIKCAGKQGKRWERKRTEEEKQGEGEGEKIPKREGTQRFSKGEIISR